MVHMVCPELCSENTEGNKGPKEKDPHQHSSSTSLALLSAHCLLLHTHLVSVLVQGIMDFTDGDGQTVVRHWVSSTQSANLSISVRQWC